MANIGYPITGSAHHYKRDAHASKRGRFSRQEFETVKSPDSFSLSPVPGLVAEQDVISERTPEPRLTNTNQDVFMVQENMIFRAYDIQRTTEQVFATRLQGMTYEPIKCRQLCHTLAAEIMERVKSLSIKRFKLVAVVSIGSLKERPGMQLGTRCLWDKDTDNFVSVKYTNTSLFAVALIYGLHFK